MTDKISFSEYCKKYFKPGEAIPKYLQVFFDAIKEEEERDEKIYRVLKTDGPEPELFYAECPNCESAMSLPLPEGHFTAICSYCGTKTTWGTLRHAGAGDPHEYVEFVPVNTSGGRPNARI